MVNVAVVGCGYWGPKLVRNFAHAKGSRLVAICDADTEKLAAVMSQHSAAKGFSNFDELLDDPAVDAIAISTPVRTHFNLARKALLKGKHVLVEKPLATSSHEVIELHRIARKHDLTLMAGHTFLYSPSIREAARLLNEGLLGDLYSIDLRRLNFGRVQTDISCLWSLGPHDVSIVLYLMGQMPLQVSANGLSVLTPGIEDTVFMNLTFSGGVMANIHMSWLSPEKVRRMVLVGSERMMTVDDGDDEKPITVHDKRVGWQQPGDPEAPRVPDLQSGAIETPSVDSYEPLKAECEHFVESINHGTEPLSGGTNALQVVQVLEAAQKSIEQNGRPVNLSANETPELAVSVATG